MLGPPPGRVNSYTHECQGKGFLHLFIAGTGPAVAGPGAHTAESRAMEAARILTALADLAPAGAERIFDVSGAGRPLIWLAEPDRAPRDATLDRLAALDALHRDQRILRRGLAFVVGAADLDGGRRRVRVPLLAQPVRLERTSRSYRIVPAGDLELTSLVEDRDLAGRLEAAPGLAGPGWLGAPGTKAWITAAAEAAGLKPATVQARPPRRIDDDGLVGVAAAALFTTRDVLAGRLRDTLLAWAARPGLADTALSRLYTGQGDSTPSGTNAQGDDTRRGGESGRRAGRGRRDTSGGSDDTEAEVLSPLPMNAAQRELVRRTRTEPVVVVSGAPGNGKSHALVAAALDAVDRGGSVLVATQSVHAADVLGDLLRRHSGRRRCCSATPSAARRSPPTWPAVRPTELTTPHCATPTPPWRPPATGWRPCRRGSSPPSTRSAAPPRCPTGSRCCPR